MDIFYVYLFVEGGYNRSGNIQVVDTSYNVVGKNISYLADSTVINALQTSVLSNGSLLCLFHDYYQVNQLRVEIFPKSTTTTTFDIVTSTNDADLFYYSANILTDSFEIYTDYTLSGVNYRKKTSI